MRLLNSYEETIILNQNNKGNSCVFCKIAKPQLDQQLYTLRRINRSETRVKSLGFGINTFVYRIDFERLTRSGLHHPKIRIRTAVRHLSIPALDSTEP